MKARAFIKRKNKVASIGDEIEITNTLSLPHGILEQGSRHIVEIKYYVPEIASYTKTNDYYLISSKTILNGKSGINSEWYKIIPKDS